MTEEQLGSLLKSSGLPVAYSHFKHSQKPPFLVYYFLEDEGMGADDELYFSDARYNVELYTEKKDPALERRLQKLLRGGGLYWEKSEAFIQDESIYEVLYQI